MKNQFLLWLSILAISLTAGADGGQSGGGGEPMAQQFITLAKQLAIFYSENPFKSKLPFNAENFKIKVSKLDKSLQIHGKTALIEFTDDILKDYAGVEKPAIFNKEKSSIRVNRKGWLSYQKDAEGRLALVTMEIAGLLDVKDNRYEICLDLVRNHAAVILSIPLGKEKLEGSNATDGMRIVGQNADQFNHISVEDIIIDGGVLGKGNALNRRVEDFFNNPAGDSDWYSLIQKAWKKDRPAFLILTGPDGNTASVSSIYSGVWKKSNESGIGIYSLFFVKYRQIYEGVCEGEAQSLSALNRLRNCFLANKYYYAYDDLNQSKFDSNGMTSAIQEAINSLKQAHIYFFAMDKRVMEAALRDNFLVNYSRLVKADYLHENYILKKSLQANGFVPSLIGPFTNSTFWTKINQTPPIDAVRFTEALKTLAEFNLGFFDSGTVCSLNGNTDKGPSLVKLSRINEYYSNEQLNCRSIYTFRPNLENELFSAMLNFGFYFNYQSKQWLHDSTVELPK